MLSQKDAVTLLRRMPQPSSASAIVMPLVEHLTWQDFLGYHCIDEAGIFSTIFGSNCGVPSKA